MVISRETQRGIFRFLISARRKVACKRLVISINFKASLLLFFSSRRRHTIYWLDWSSDVCSSDLALRAAFALVPIQLSVGYEFNALLQEISNRAGSAASLAELRGRHESVLGLIESALSGKAAEDRKSVVEGKSVDLGGRRII